MKRSDGPWRRLSWRWLGLGLLVAAGIAAALFANHRAERQRQRSAALDLVRLGRFPEAVLALEQVLADDPRDAELVRALVIAQLKSGTLLTDVEPLLTRWCQLRPGDPEPWKLRLDVRSRLGQTADALADGLRVLELTPDDDEVREQVADLLLAAGRFTEAERECRRCLQTQSGRRTELLYLLAKIHKVGNHPDQAAAALDDLLRQRPDFTPAVVMRGLLHLEAGQPDKAVALLRPALDQDPAFRQSVRYHLGLALVRSGQGEEGQKLLAEMESHQNADRLLQDVKQQPDNLDLRVRAAVALLRVERREEAEAQLRHVLARAPEHAAARRLLDSLAP